MLIYRHGKLEEESHGRLIRRAEAQSLDRVLDAMAAAEQEAEEIRRQAREEFENQKRKGYEEGLEDGNGEIALKQLELVEKSVDYLNSMENTVVDIVLAALRKCIAEIGDRELLEQVIIKAMRAIVNNQARVTLRVSPDMLQAVRERLKDILAGFPAVNYIEAEADESLNGVSCLLVTDVGNVEASLDRQLANIEKVLRKCFDH